ncbi:MAG: ABC transporter permease subunit [Rhodococcus sp. (in: high G+C Gram-positive bacteria)]|uniref:ABC transporter permease n=1 Tax=Rhodococcus sp. EPR-157 TaxID=1813677 RepID=UPI000B00FD74|nr:ABC transporter permease subunit [Rhodococcus sp. EPR-157]
MNGTLPLLRLRAQEIYRTWRIWVLPAVMVLLAASSAALARFTNEILASALAGEAGAISLPDPTAADSYAQWTKTLTQIIVLVVIVMAAGAINSEVRSGVAATILVKPASRTAYVLTHALALVTLVAGSALAGGCVSWLATQAFFGPSPIGPVLGATAVWVVLATVLISASLLASATIDAAAGAAGIGIGLFFALAILGVIPQLAEYTPVGLMQVVNALAVGTQSSDHTLWWPLGTSLLLTGLLLTATVLAFRRAEI